MAELTNGMDGIMKAWVASTVSLNSNFGDLSFRNGSINTEGIRTLGDYMHKERPEKLKNWNKELNDDDKLMRTYVVPITLPNGENIDIVVNSKGQDIAQIYVNEEGGSRFHLDDSVRDKIVTMAGKEVLTRGKYNREFMPKDLEELAEKISKDELVPKDTEKVEERKKKADDKAMDDSRDEENEKTPEEIAEEAGVSVSALEKFCEENEIPMSAIKGAAQIQKTDRLEDKMEKNLDVGDGETITALRISGIDGNTNDTLGMMKSDGSTLDMDGENNDLLEKLVPEGYNAVEEEDADKLLQGDKIKIHNDVTGKETEYEIDPSNEGNGIYFKEQLQKLKDEVDSACAAIMEKGDLTPEDYRQIANIKADGYGRLCSLEQEADVNADSVQESMLAEAQEAENKAALEESALLKAGRAVGNVAKSVGVALINGKEKEDDGEEEQKVPGPKINHYKE